MDLTPWNLATTQGSPLVLKDKAIVIVGGSSGLGRSAAEACVAAGARVVIVGRTEPKIAAVADALGESARAVVGDARQPDTADRAIEKCLDAFGRIDALYHVAGGSGRSAGDGPLHAISDEGWRATLDWNLDSLFYSNRAAARQFLAQGRGCVLNMASVLGIAPAPRHFATHAYAAAKAAIIGLTRAAAAYYAPHNIRFNAVAPALVETPMSTRATRDLQIQRYIAARQPLGGGQVSQPQDLDGAVVYLLSDAARLVTGQVLAVDGGWCASDGAPADTP